MKYYKITLSNGGKIVIEDNELKAVLEMIKDKFTVIMCKNGIFNPSYMVSIDLDKDKNSELVEQLRLGMEVKEGVSIFASVLSEQMKLK